MPPLKIQKLFPYQQADKVRPEQFKLKRWGRRTGKSRDMLHCGTLGHGPLEANGEPKWKGLAQHKNVLWIGPDYTQLNTVWREEIYPRFNGADGCSTNENEMTAYCGDSRLIMRTANKENHKALRGMGKNLGGIIIDEAAHLDCEALMTDVILPMTLDEDGWIMLSSTPNAGSDGYVDEEGSKRTPSYFNVLCEQQQLGVMEGWHQSHHDARSNPRIKPAAFRRLVEQYANQPLKLRQEVYAELLRGGAGFAFPELDETIHSLLLPPAKITETVGVCDWGWSAHGYLGLLGMHQRGAHLMTEMPFNGPIDPKLRRDAEKVGFDCGREWLQQLAEGSIPMLPEIVWCDSAMDAVNDGGLSVMALMQAGFERSMSDRAPTLICATKGPGSRVMRKTVFHALLRHKTMMAENGMMVMLEAPRFTFATRCSFAWRTCKALMVDPKHPEDVDTTGPDHAYDGITYGLSMVFPDLTTRKSKPVDPRLKTDPMSAREDAEYDALTDPALARKRDKSSAKVYG